MRPIFHLSVPVKDLEEAITFYRVRLGARIGRQTETFADALVFGAQVTLQNDPSSVTDPMPRTRHFGATLPWTEWEAMAARLEGSDIVVEDRTISCAGEAFEQGKMMIKDPTGNLIEVKAYRHPEEVFGPLVKIE
jgi:extradiol dioxygenase family protein